MKKVDYLVTAKCEVLYEYANSVMAKYEDYLDSESALDCIKNIKEFDSIIKHISDSVMSGV